MLFQIFKKHVLNNSIRKRLHNLQLYLTQMCFITRFTRDLFSNSFVQVTNAIRNSLKSNQSGQPCDGPMGISVALSPTTVVSTVSRAITNASFRAKKLPGEFLF